MYKGDFTDKKQHDNASSQKNIISSYKQTINAYPTSTKQSNHQVEQKYQLTRKQTQTRMHVQYNV